MGAAQAGCVPPAEGGGCPNGGTAVGP
jgi:hypothetical protein